MHSPPLGPRDAKARREPAAKCARPTQGRAPATRPGGTMRNSRDAACGAIRLSPIAPYGPDPARVCSGYSGVLPKGERNHRLSNLSPPVRCAPSPGARLAPLRHMLQVGPVTEFARPRISGRWPERVPRMPGLCANHARVFTAIRTPSSFNRSGRGIPAKTPAKTHGGTHAIRASRASTPNVASLRLSRLPWNSPSACPGMGV